MAEDETLSELAESIKEFGIVTPIITRPKEDGDGYEVIAGQRRVRASELAGINTVPAFVLPLDRDRAIITLVDSNLQRENILPSERAFAYKMKSEAMKRQGFRTDLTSSQVVTKLRTDDKVAQGFGVGRMTVQRFIRLTELIPPILQMVDEGKIALTPAVELSFLKKDEQENLFATMESEEATPSLSQAQRMKQLSQSGRLDMDTIFAIMTEEKGNQKETLKINTMLTIIFKTGETQNKDGKQFKSKRKNAKLETDKLCPQNSDEDKKLYSQGTDYTCGECSIDVTSVNEVY